mgnify:CR=1 FL=1
MQDAPVIPVIVLNDVAHAVPMARALVAGGVRMLEVTLRTQHGLGAIKAMTSVEGAIVGVGTAGCGDATGFSEMEILAMAARTAVHDAGLKMSDIDGLGTPENILLVVKDGVAVGNRGGFAV